MLENIKAVLFDLDGTLVDSMWIWKQIDIEYLGKFGIELPEDLQIEIEGMSFTETAHYFQKRFGITDSIQQIKNDWNAMAWDKYTNQVPFKHGVKDFLNHCKTHGIKMGIGTSNSIELVQNITKVHEFDHYFTSIKTSCDAKKGKPAPDIYLLVAEELGVAPDQCLVFEDIVPGILAGKNAGMKVCAVEDEYSSYQSKDKRNFADYYIQDFTDILTNRYEVLG